MQKQHSSKVLTTLLMILLMAPLVLAAIPIASATTSGTMDVRPTNVIPGVGLKIVLNLTITGDVFDIYVSKNGYSSIVGDLRIFTGLPKADRTATKYWSVPTTGDYSLAGDYWIKATDDLGATVVVSNKFTVAAVPIITLDVTSGTLPKTVKIAGEGFPKSVTRKYEVYWDKFMSPDNRIAGPLDVTTGADGKFKDLAVSIENAPLGARSILFYLYDAAAVKAEYGTVTTFTVQPLATVAQPSVLAGTAAQGITVSGRGFAPGDIAENSITVLVRDIITGATLKTSATTHGKITVDYKGSLPSTAVTITEALPMGTADLTVAGFSFADAFLSSKIGAAGEFVVKVGKSSGNVGDSVSFLGIGFGGTAANSVELRFYDPVTGIPTVIKMFTPDANGAVKGTFTVPNLAKAVYSMRVLDNNKPFEKAATPSTFEIIPKLIVVQTEAFVGETINMYGTGFPAGYKASKVLIGGVEHTWTVPTAEVVAGTDGTWASAGAPVTFALKDVSGGGLARPVELSGIPAASIKVKSKVTEIFGSTTAGAFTDTKANLGDYVRVKGTGYLAGETVTISYILAGAVKATAVIKSGGTTGTDGKLTVVFDVPLALSPATTYDVKVAGPTSTNAYTTSLTTYNYTIGEKVKIYLGLKPDGTVVTKGYVGDTIVVTGTGTPDSKETVKWDTTTMAADVPVTKGYFTATITVPETQHGKYAVSYEGVALSADYTVHAKITLSPTEGYMGNVTTITGNGFKASDTIKILWNLIPLKTVTASDKGSFTTTFTVPTSSPGFYRIDAVMTATADNSVPALTIPDADDVLTASFTVLEAVPVWVAELRKSLADLSKVVDALSKTVAAQGVDITALKTALSDLSKVVDAMKTDVTATKTVVDALKTALTALQSAVATLQTDLTTTKGLAGDAKTAATDAKTSATAAQSAAAGLTTLVYVAIVLSLIAAIAAVVAVIQLQRKVAG